MILLNSTILQIIMILPEYHMSSLMLHHNPFKSLRFSKQLQIIFNVFFQPTHFFSCAKSCAKTFVQNVQTILSRG